MHGVFETFGHLGQTKHLAAPAKLGSGGQPLTVAIVNNMPDTALLATERQFTRLILQAAGVDAHIELYHIPTLPRGEQARAMLAERYRPVGELYLTRPDAVIVTGNEPRADRLDAEPYWPDLTRLIDWAATAGCTALWSCLAAHAAVLHLDSIERRRLPAKLSGVIRCATSGAGRRTGLPAELAVCHSRLNEAPRDELRAAGYTILSQAGGGTVDVFSKRFGGNFLFLQGHPEYDADSLLREYRRDVGRFLGGAQPAFPALPENYFDDATGAALMEFRQRAEADRRPELIAALPAMTLRAGLEDQLARSAAAVFGGWIGGIREHRLAG